MKYIKQLDSLRAIAAVLVLIEHWIPVANLRHRIHYGELGVDLFFVLSGFLISRILLENKDAADIGASSRKLILTRFYLRRALRIFPIYYLTIFTVLYFAAYTQTRVQIAFPWYASYTANWFMFYHGWDGIMSHLWTLSVEEQFYIIWPLLLLFSPKRWLPVLIGGFIVSGVVSNYLVAHRPLGTVLTFTCFDAFGMGALLAWLERSGEERIKRILPFLSIAALFSLLLFAIGVWRFKYDLVPLRTLYSMMSLWMIAYVVYHAGKGSLKGRWLLENKTLLFLGRISYGLYLYHNFIPLINKYTINAWLDPLMPDFMLPHLGKLHLLESFGVLILLSWLSYVFIEKKFLHLKSYFEYTSGPRTGL